jgi:hypothetical protein
MFDFLGLWRFAIYAAVIASFAGAIYYAKGKYDAGQQEIGAAPYKIAIANQKQEAAEKLAAAIASVEAQVRERDGRIASIVEGYSDERIKSAADFDRRLVAAGRLRDPEAPRCWGSSGSPPSGKTANAATTESASGGEGGFLSVRFDRLLKDLIRDTDALIAHDRLCVAYAREISAE